MFSLIPSTCSNSQPKTDHVLEISELLLPSDEITQRPCSTPFPRVPQEDSSAVAQVTAWLIKHP